MLARRFPKYVCLLLHYLSLTIQVDWMSLQHPKEETCLNTGFPLQLGKSQRNSSAVLVEHTNNEYNTIGTHSTFQTTHGLLNQSLYHYHQYKLFLYTFTYSIPRYEYFPGRSSFLITCGIDTVRECFALILLDQIRWLSYIIIINISQNCDRSLCIPTLTSK